MQIASHNEYEMYEYPKEWGDCSHLYVVVDAARHKNIYPMLMASKAEFTCLYNGEIPLQLARVAPYLVKFSGQSPLLQTLFQEGMFDSWGIFFISYATSKELKRHFQSLLKVRTEEGKVLYFRFYDPRVMRAYLPTCTKEELTSVFGPVKSFWIEEYEIGCLSIFQREGQKFLKTPYQLDGFTS